MSVIAVWMLKSQLVISFKRVRYMQMLLSKIIGMNMDSSYVCHYNIAAKILNLFSCF